MVIVSPRRIVKFLSMVLIAANTARVDFLGWVFGRYCLVFLNKQKAMPVAAQASQADRQNGPASRQGSLRDSQAGYAMATSGNVRLQILRVRADKRGMLRTKRRTAVRKARAQFLVAGVRGITGIDTMLLSLATSRT